MPLPFVSEPLKELKQRYSRALEVVHDMESIRLGVVVTPGHFRSNVFDCPDGLRLIVSREMDVHGIIRLHLSASLQIGSAFFKLLKRYRDNPNKIERRLRMLVERRFRDLSGDERQLMFLFWTCGYVPHWCIEEESCPKEKQRESSSL